MKINKKRKGILLVTGTFLLILFGFREKWGAFYWYCIDIGYKYCEFIEYKDKAIAAIIIIAYVLLLMVKDD